MSNIIFNSPKEFKEAMLKLAETIPNRYQNIYPYNCLYWDGSKLWGDCVNIFKMLFNGFDLNRIKEKTPDPLTKCKYKGFSNTSGDVNEWELISQMNPQRFTVHLGNDPECLYMEGHFGGYLGEEIEKISEMDNKKYLYNVVECTPWDGDFHGGIMYSYVDPITGKRYNHKGGNNQRGTWSHHGRPERYVNYNHEEQNLEDEEQNLEDDEEKKLTWEQFEPILCDVLGEWLKEIITEFKSKWFE